MTDPRSVHEPNEELLSAEEAIADADRLEQLFLRHRHAEQAISVQIPLRALLAAIDQLDLPALREVARRTEARLAAVESA